MMGGGAFLSGGVAIASKGHRETSSETNPERRTCIAGVLESKIKCPPLLCESILGIRAERSSCQGLCFA